MELRRLRYFVAVAESGNISKAAQKIFLTQPALSRQIKALEDAVGKLLIERQPHSIRLTPAGELLLHEARELLQHADEVLERVRSSGQGLRLRIGYAPTLASGLLSEAVENFIQKHRDARVELLDLSSQEMLAGLEAGTLDVALTVAPEREIRGLRWAPLIQVTWMLAINHRHPLTALPELTLEQAAAEPWLVFHQRDYPEYRHLLTTWLREQGACPTIAGEYDGITSLLAAVESGLGVALVTSNSVEFTPKRVRLKSLSSTPKKLSIAAGYREDRKAEKPLVVFLEELRYAAKGVS